MSADQDFKKLIRSMHRFLKAYHHALSIQTSSSQNQQPVRLSRIADRLSTVVQPAIPNPTTELLIYGNARNWLHIGVDILQDHYREALRTAQADLVSASRVRWEEAWQIAIKWARRNLKMLRETTIQSATSAINSLMTDVPQSTGNIILTGQQVVQPEADTILDQPTQATIFPIPQSVPTIPPKPSEDNGNRGNIAGDTNTDISSPPVRGTVLGQPKNTEEPFNLVRSKSVDSANSQTASLNIRQLHPSFSPVSSQCSHHSIQLFPEADPEGDMGILADPTRSPCSVRRNLEFMHQDKIPSPQFPVLRPLEEPSRSTRLVDSPVDLQTEVQTFLQDNTNTGPHPSLCPLANRPNATNLTIQTADSHIRVQSTTLSIHARHEHFGDKYKNWFLTPTRPILFIGDSNLSCFPQIENAMVQVESYPGANLAHAYHILKHKTPQSPDVQHSVLCFGLNNREQGNPAIWKKSVERLLGAATQVFPNAVLHIPLINYDKTLPRRTIDNIRILNDLFQNTGCSIPLLPWESFRAQADKVHWTSTTAKAMFVHWLDHLN